MVKEINSLSELKNALKEMVKDCLENDVDKIVKNVMWSNIWEHVYDVYDPKVYERRYEKEGLIDPKNLVSFPLNDGLGREFYNVTKKNSVRLDEYLAPLIEYGTKNPVARYQYPRPFIKKTREELINGKQHLKAFQNYFLKRGIKCEYKK